MSDATPPTLEPERPERPARDTGPDSGDESPRRRVTPVGVLLTFVVAVFAVFWTWALFFASKEAINKVDDREWAARAEAICEPVELELLRLDLITSEDLEVRADLVVQSTDLLSAMLDDIEAVPPSDEKGQAIVPEWIADYRTLLDDRYAYADRLRAGEDGPFVETAVSGVPITERIETFAGDNEMPSCAPPRKGVL